MRFYKTRRLRIISSASLLLLLTGFPVALGLMRPSTPAASEVPGFVVAYKNGMSSLGGVGYVAICFAVLFGVWLLATKRHEISLRYLNQGIRRRRNLVETSRTFAIIIGAAGLIVGSLAGFYAAIMHARPDLADRLILPFLTAELAMGGLVGGGLLYALGRINRW